MPYTAHQVAAMAGHFRGCSLCGRDDPVLTADLNEGLDVDELADAISTAHDPAWLRILLGCI